MPWTWQLLAPVDMTAGRGFGNDPEAEPGRGLRTCNKLHTARQWIEKGKPGDRLDWVSYDASVRARPDRSVRGKC